MAQNKQFQSKTLNKIGNKCFFEFLLRDTQKSPKERLYNRQRTTESGTVLDRK